MMETGKFYVLDPAAKKNDSSLVILMLIRAWSS